MRDAAQWVTDLADGAVLLPLAALVACGLAVGGRWRAALAWAGCVGGTLGLMLGLKLLVAGCGGPLLALGLRSPSGHTAAAAVIGGGLVALLAGLRGWDAALPGLLVAAVIAATRIALRVHSLADVMVGAAVGVGGSMALAWLGGGEARGRFRPRGALLLVLAGVVLLALLHGRRLDVEGRIHALGLRLGAAVCRPGA